MKKPKQKTRKNLKIKIPKKKKLKIKTKIVSSVNFNAPHFVAFRTDIFQC